MGKRRVTVITGEGICEMIVSRMIVPKAEPDCPLLYFRGDGETVNGNELRVKPHGNVTFDTYFNGLFYGPYLHYTRIKALCLHVVISGAADLVLSVVGQDGESIVLEEMQMTGTREECVFAPVSLQDQPQNGMLYLTVRAMSGEALLHSAYYETQADASPIQIAAVICTYRRETCVFRNLSAIRNGIRDCEPELGACLDVFLADNGNSLTIADEPQTYLLPGKNCGGSGGFTRGLLAAYDAGRYSHVLFMDDDIVFEPETLARTIRFLQAAIQTERPLCIGGQMLIEDSPTIQHEAGSSYIHGWLRPIGRGRNLADRNALMENAQPEKCQFNAWWYCCFPISVVDKIGLPLPLFIKTDDVEYGLRMLPDVVLMNGIGVWHMSFAEKYSPHLEYYIKRNELLISAIHRSGAGSLPAVVKLLGCCINAVRFKQNARIAFALRGYEDFLKGPDFLKQTDPEELNAALLAKRDALEKAGLNVWKQLGRIAKMLLMLMLFYHRARRAFMNQCDELTSVPFWRRYLSAGRKA